MKVAQRATTGIPSIDTLIEGLRTGDNVVWQVDGIDDYVCFTEPFIGQVIGAGQTLHYVRFAHHQSLADAHPHIVTHHLDASRGFETFSTQMHTIIRDAGTDGRFVFDCLSDLLSAWATDLMIGNFFMIACPLLYTMNAVAYFSLLRSRHSFKTVARIRETTQLFIDVHTTGSDRYIHPLKVQDRHSPRMFLPHKQHGDQFEPITNSTDAAQLIQYVAGTTAEPGQRNIDSWDRLFMRVHELLQQEQQGDESASALELIFHVMIGRETRILDLAKKHLSLQDLVAIRSRLIGTGFIGGKAAGMIIARKVLEQADPDLWRCHMEPHDSFFIGSDVFYTYIVQNGWWDLLMQHKTPEGYYPAGRRLRQYMLSGSFPDEIEEQFWQMIDYYGQSPIIVRSSSLLEDAFGNAFAGKYESIFCVNQGSPEERFRTFRQCVRRVFASAMDEDALTYRMQRGLADQDEQMAILVQRVSGSYRDSCFFPDLAGVGISYNPFTWDQRMDPRAGMLRLVIGLGTRAVNRVAHDYPRIVALDAPSTPPQPGMELTRHYSQHYLDLLDIEQNKLRTAHLADLSLKQLRIRDDMLGTWCAAPATGRSQSSLIEPRAFVVTFERLLHESPFIKLLTTLLRTLEQAYQHPVDTEFTCNFTASGDLQVNLVQCRPLQTNSVAAGACLPETIAAEDLLFKTRGGFMGAHTDLTIDWIVFVDPPTYSRLPLQQRHDISRAVSRLNRALAQTDQPAIMLIGPGRWGTSTPSLGVPVRFADISNVAVIMELAYAAGSLVPDLSYGTHFFQDLVEADIFYLALFPDQQEAYFNIDLLGALPNQLPDLVPDLSRLAPVLRVCHMHPRPVRLTADFMTQQVTCFRT